jgi:hypothetical protein
VTAQPAPPVLEPRSAGGRGWLVAGLLLAAGGTAAVVVTDDARYLRIALLAVCWAFVVVALVAGNRRADQVEAAAREAQLRHAYDLELEREVTARHQFEVELEGRLRREAADAVGAELTQVRDELSGLSALREDLAAVPGLRADLTGLGDLRAELAGLGRLRTEIAALTEMRGELTGMSQLRAGLGELRSDLGRIRSELSEQLSGELLVERMVMRAQSVRGGAQSGPGADGRVLEGGATRESQPLTAGWDVDRWAETRVVQADPAGAAPRPAAEPRSPVGWRGGRSLPDADGQPVAAPTVTPEQASAPWATAADAPTPEPVSDAGASYDSSRYDALLFGTATSSGSPSAGGTPSGWAAAAGDEVERGGSTAYGARSDASRYPEPADEPARATAPEPQGHARLEQILAESGVQAPTGGRSRRRRYRDEDGDPTDDVLARVLGRS